MARKNESNLTQRQLEELGRALREKREQLQARQVELDEQRIVEPEADLLDSATDAVASADGEALSAHDTYLLAEVESALSRMAAGRYGLSEQSGDPIPFARLRLVPWARRNADEEEDRSRGAAQFR